tara:strand:- start:120 stop:1184 length:1065 start_codon:yes stop_codon:yes gene_type:complete
MANYIGGSSLKPEFWSREEAEKAKRERQAYFDATGQTARQKHYETTGEILPAESFIGGAVNVPTHVTTGQGFDLPRSEVAYEDRVAQGSGSGGSPGMSLADLFDNSKWETHMVDAAPKRGGQVERRRYIGGGGGQNVPVSDPSVSSAAPEFRSDGYRHEDHLAERFRNRDTSGPVTLPPVDSLDKQDMLDVAGRVGQAPEPPGPSWFERAGKTGIEYGADAWDAVSGFAGDVNRGIESVDQSPAAAAASNTIGDFRESLDPMALQDLLRGEVDKHDNWLADRYRNIDDSARWLRGNAERLDHQFEAPEALTNTAGVNPLGTIGTAGLGIYDLIKYYMGLKDGYNSEQYTIDKEY